MFITDAQQRVLSHMQTERRDAFFWKSKRERICLILFSLFHERALLSIRPNLTHIQFMHVGKAKINTSKEF